MLKKLQSGFVILVIAGLTICFSACKKDNTPPVITILGNNPLFYCIQEPDTPPYEDPGATALDDEDGDITSDITTTVNVKVNVPGTYTVVYKAEDKAGNTGTATRTVQVMYCK